MNVSLGYTLDDDDGAGDDGDDDFDDDEVDDDVSSDGGGLWSVKLAVDLFGLSAGPVTHINKALISKA